MMPSARESAEANDRAWRHLADLIDDALIARDDAVSEEGRDRRAIEPRLKRGKLIERLELGCECDSETALCVQQGFDSKSVANETTETSSHRPRAQRRTSLGIVRSALSNPSASIASSTTSVSDEPRQSIRKPSRSKSARISGAL